MSFGSVGRLAPPPLPLLALEGRAGLEFGILLANLPLLRRAPHGDGHPVLVFPGFTAGDVSTLALRQYLSSLGYQVHGWRLGRNRGPSSETLIGMQSRFEELKRRYGQKISLIGWSLGGIYAREIARAFPGDVRLVITLASPFKDPMANNVSFLASAAAAGLEDEPALLEQLRRPLRVPSTAIYTRSDGIVNWRSCVEKEGPQAENVGVWSSHCGLGHHPKTFRVIADRLAQKEGEWVPYDS
ncbi:MAG: alpha/beta hydrolase [Myxococcota bacterium]|nr:alpha/beta hydrolase [Myxococcota bacterium]